MSAHTPGPWELNTTKVGGAIVRWHIAGPKHGSVYPICEHIIEVEPDATEQFHNSILIAAAPELLDALIHIQQVACSGSPELEIANEVLAKFTGGQP